MFTNNCDCLYNTKNNKTSFTKIYPELDNKIIEYKLNFDGCSKGNPGLSGAGAVIYHFNIEIWAEGLYIGKNYTNNYSEYMGLIFGLQQAKKLNIKNLIVEGDSLLVINQMKGKYKCNSADLLNLYRQAKELEKSFERIEYYHIYRNYNKRSDQLANNAIRRNIINTLL
jgi:ribonuclease HI